MSNKSHSLFSGKSIAGGLLVVALAVFGVLQVETTPNNNHPRQHKKLSPSELSDYYDISDIRYKGKKLKMTKHGKCRMGCREIDAFEVNEILTNGKINQRKSQPNASPCPKYAIEGQSRDGQTIRVVIADCDRDVKLVTVIDLKNDYKCTCK